MTATAAAAAPAVATFTSQHLSTQQFLNHNRNLIDEISSVFLLPRPYFKLATNAVSIVFGNLTAGQF